MVNKSAQTEAARQALHEHQSLQKLFTSIVRFVADEPEPTTEVVEKLVDDLRDLRSQLECHFEREEGEGLFEGILEEMPMVQADVEALRREHVTFLSNADVLIRRLKRPVESEFDRHCEDLKRFFRAFQKHEQTENSLVQRAYSLDLGTAD